MKDLAIYEKLYDDCESILNGEKWLDTFTGKLTDIPNIERLELFNTYLKQYLNESNSGILRTLLIISKPYKNHSIITETYNKLVNRHKTI